jgi:phosphinothricin acetyltransferase
VPVGVYRNVGFKFGRWHDVAWFALRLRDDAAPAAPRLADQVLKEDGVAAMVTRCADSVRLA